MISMSKELNRLSHALAWRGALLLLLGVGAVAAPEDLLIAALLAVGAVSALFGLYEMSIAISLHKRARWWKMVLAHGGLSVVFGMLTVGATGVRLVFAIGVTTAWFLAYAVLSLKVALDLPPRSVARRGLMGWTAIGMAIVLLGVLSPMMTIFTLLYGGAMYAVVYGAWQLAVGLWLRHALHASHAHGGHQAPPVRA